MAAAPRGPAAAVPSDEFEDEPTRLPPPRPGMWSGTASHVALAESQGTGRLYTTAEPPVPGRSGAPRMGAGEVAEHLALPPAPLVSLTDETLHTGENWRLSDPVMRSPAPSAPPAWELRAAPVETWTLRPLPTLSADGSGTALLVYAWKLRMSERARRTVIGQVVASLRRETEALDRAMIDLGQMAYIDRRSLSGFLPPDPSDPAAPIEQRIYAWMQRIDAEQLRQMALLLHEESQVATQLGMGVVPRAQALLRMSTLRLLRWTREHAHKRTRDHQGALQQCLFELLTRGEAGSMPNLMLVGALLLSGPDASLDVPSSPTGGAGWRRSGEASTSTQLQVTLSRLYDRLLSRVSLLVEYELERGMIQREAVVRADYFVLVLLVTALLCSGIAWWALSG